MAAGRSVAAKKKGASRRQTSKRGGKVSPSEQIGVSRGVVVSAALFLGLAATAGLLIVLSPGPLLPGVSARLFAQAQSSRNLEESQFSMIFETRAPIHDGWRQIVLTASATDSGDTYSLPVVESDQGPVPSAHFVVGNGRGTADGEIQITGTWTRQVELAGDSIVICLIADPGTSPITGNQQAMTQRLLNELAGRFRIPVSAIENRLGVPYRLE